MKRKSLVCFFNVLSILYSDIIMMVQSLKYIGKLLFDIKGVKAEPKRKRNIVQHARSNQPLQNSSNLNNQTTRTATEPSLPRNQSSPLLNSRSSTDLGRSVSDSKSSVEARKPPVFNPLHTGITKSKNPSPSDALNISTLTIGNLISSEKSKSCTETSDCVTDRLPPSNRDNQSRSKSDGDKQSVSESENSTSEEMDRSLILVTDNIASPSSPQRQYTCRVLHCEAVFTSQAKLNLHMNQFGHSPCNPCLKAKNGKLLPDPICYMCPKCDEDFKTTSECSAHMRSQNHLPYLPPLMIAGYICPQCLAIFETFEACWDHIAKLSHHFVSYPFLDDLKGRQPAEVGPVAVSEELAMDFIDKCKKVPFRVQCLECSLEIETAMMLRQHRAETNGQHPISSLANSNPVDIFADYLAEFQCCNCYRLFNTYVPTHYCARDIQGTLIESNVKSFHDFVKSCALTLSHAEPDSLSTSTTDCAESTHGQSSCLKNLIQVVQHSPEKGAIPKNKKHTNTVNTTSQVKPVQNITQENKRDDVIVIGTPPDPPKTKHGRMIEIPVEEQSINVDEHLYKRKKTRLETESPTGASAERAETESHRDRSRSPTTPHPTATENLVKMKNIIFLDLDNWPGFFSKLPRRLPDLTFVWGFYGGKVVWREPYRCFAFGVMKQNNLFFLNDRCGHTKDAADFAIVLAVGQMHERLPKHIPFTIVSGDKGFIEVERQMRDSHRKAVVIDPHSAQQFSNDMIYTMVTSVADT